MPKLKGGPGKIWLLRHGQSAGNIALEEAEKLSASQILVTQRDIDVPLSTLGEKQAEAFAAWAADLPPPERPTKILCSPYIRAFETAKIVAAKLGLEGSDLILDERLREREFGIVDRLTKKGILEKFPEQAEIHDWLKKFYYRAPGGESWCDVLLRLRSFEETIARDYEGESILIVCHTVVILCFRYLFEQLSEKQILDIDAETKLANASLTSYKKMGNKLILDNFNFVAPLKENSIVITRSKDAPEKS